MNGMKNEERRGEERRGEERRGEERRGEERKGEERRGEERRGEERRGYTFMPTKRFVQSFSELSEPMVYPLGIVFLFVW
jgi:hypothetical protein